ncbi:MAG: Xaa-Pro aminopeptidase [Bacteroidia bacterium]
MKFRFFLFLPLLFVVLTALKTDSPDYDQDLLSPEFHAGRREALRKLMPDSSCAVFFSAPVRNRANDVDYDFHQDPNFYYLTGFREPNAMLIVFKEKQRIDTVFTDEILLVQEKNPGQEAWTGRRYGPAGASEHFKIRYVISGRDFDRLLVDFKSFEHVFAFPEPNDIRDNADDPADLYSLVKKFFARASGKKLDTRRLGQMMAMLRQIKQPEEMVLLRKAIEISNQAHIEVMKALTAGMTEYHIQAMMEYEFRMRGAETVGYPSICGAGENSCILHYTSNRKPMEKNDLIVVDAGAEYHGYTADITRTMPANGKFSPEQYIIYNIVLEAQEAGIKASIKGNEFRAPHKAAIAVIKKRLKALGIIQHEEDYGRYFFHGTSHYLGLDVHDAGMYGHLTPGNVITVEPGIYIPEGSPCDPKWWNIGVRIEDDILITETEPEVLSAAVPKGAAEIEKMMEKESYLNKRQ